MIAVAVLAASAHDNVVGTPLLDKVAAETGTAKRPWWTGISKWSSTTPEDTWFVPQPKRWVVEQIKGILMLHRRLVRDYEHRPTSGRGPGRPGR